MQYTGQTSLTVDALGNLKIATTLGTLKQPKAKAYTMNNTTGVLTLLGWQPTYVVTGGNKVSFTYGTWPAGSTLVLEIEKDNEELSDYEPVANLGWSTYAGGNSFDSYNSTTTDASGFQYAAGETWSAQFPAFGAGQSNNFAIRAAVWSKFDEVHEMEFSTTYGGANTNSIFTETIAADIDVIAPSGATDHAVFLVGSTTYPDLDMLSFDGADNDLTMTGSGDGFIARFNTEGLLTWARYYGGDGNDGIYSVDHDDAQNIYFLGYTNVSNNFPLFDIGGDGYYESTLPGNGDVFVGKINTTLNVTWSTYYGGSAGIDQPKDLVFDREQNTLYITGGTSSNNLPLGSVYYDNTFGGVFDAFVTKFSSSGVLLWGTYLGGNSIEGLSSDVSISPNNKLYFTTDTYSSDLYTNYGSLTWGDNSFGGVGDLFIFVLDVQTMVPVWASYFGESELEQSATILHDNGNGFFLSGATESDNYTLQDNVGTYYQQGYQPSNCTNSDEAFLVHFYSSYQKDWLTYFGGVDSCTGIWTSAENPQDMALYSSSAGSFLYMVGRTGDFEYSSETENFPRVDFDGADEVSYFDPGFNAGQYDGFISMFKVNEIASNINTVESKTDNLVIYPSPSSQQINVLVTNKNGKNLDLIIYNNVGQVVYSQPNVKDGSNTININTLAYGYYVVLVKDNNLVVDSGRFIEE
jgi:Secretion system C-terminal sorting domain/Beta-propeller repeat